MALAASAARPPPPPPLPAPDLRPDNDRLALSVVSNYYRDRLAAVAVEEKEETAVAVEGHPSASTPASLSAANGQAKMKEKRMKKETIEAVGGHPNALTPASSSASDWRPGQPGQLLVGWAKKEKVALGKDHMGH